MLRNVLLEEWTLKNSSQNIKDLYAFEEFYVTDSEISDVTLGQDI